MPSLTCAAPYVTSFLTHNSKSDTVGFIITYLLMPKDYLLKYILEKPKFTSCIFFLTSAFLPPPPLSCDANPQILQAVSQIIYA